MGVVRALVMGYQSSIHGMTINVGTGHTFSVKEVADLVSRNQKHVAPRRNDLQGTMADTCRAKRLLHFEAEHEFITTMREMIADARIGSVEYLASMWKEPMVIEAM